MLTYWRSYFSYIFSVHLKKGKILSKLIFVRDDDYVHRPVLNIRVDILHAPPADWTTFNPFLYCFSTIYLYTVVCTLIFMFVCGQLQPKARKTTAMEKIADLTQPILQDAQIAGFPISLFLIYGARHCAREK